MLIYVPIVYGFLPEINVIVFPFAFSKDEWVFDVASSQRPAAELSPSDTTVIIVIIIIITSQGTESFRERHHRRRHGYVSVGLLVQSGQHHVDVTATRGRCVTAIIRHAVVVLITVIHISNKDSHVVTVDHRVTVGRRVAIRRSKADVFDTQK